jgi:glutathione S-transferase
MSRNRLIHFPLSAPSRLVRLALGELEITVDLLEERPWEWRPAFLAVNPAGELPVLELDGVAPLIGAYAACEFICERPIAPPSEPRRHVQLLPGGREDRAEARRLVDWFLHKTGREVTGEMLAQKVEPIYTGASGDPHQVDVLRAARQNLRYHLSYIAFLADQRRWLAGDEMSIADLAAAAQLSILDYLNEVTWDDFPAAKAWYQRIKSRRSMRPLLADRVPGLPPPLAYTDLDF